MRSCAAIVPLFVLIGCGSSSDRPIGADGATLQDAGVSDATSLGSDAFDFSAFASSVRAAALGSGSIHNCAVALPATEVANAGKARDAIRSFVAGVVGVPASQVTPETVPCGGMDRISCSGQFQHDIYKGDGRMGDALLPWAEIVESGATTVENILWSPMQGIQTLAPALTIHTIREDRIFGIVFFYEQPICP